MSCYRRANLILLTVLLTLMAATLPALGQQSPAGIVDDQSNRLTKAQLESLEQALSGKRFVYRVRIVEQAFATENPVDKEARFTALAGQWAEEMPLPKDGVLIAIAMKERLVQFRVWDDGSVNALFRQTTGREFGDHAGLFLDAFRGPAGSGDMLGAVLATVSAIEEVASKPPADSPPANTAPPVSTASPPIRTVPDTAPSYLPVSAAPGVESSPILWWWLLGGAGGIGITAWIGQGVGYRRRRHETLAARDQFLGDLLGMMQRDIPLARNYDGEETRQHAQEAVAEAERSLQVQQAGEEQRKAAEHRAGRLRFVSASRLMDQARRSYEQAAEAFGTARKAYAPILEAVQGYDNALRDARGEATKAGQTVESTQRSTGWPLPVLVGQLDAQTLTLAGAEAARQEDPVRALRLVREALTGCEGILATLLTLATLRQRYDEQQLARKAAEAEVENARLTLGLRFVEQNPSDSLARAVAQEQVMMQRMPEGNVPAAAEALEMSAAAVSEGLAILKAYRKALTEYPEKMTQLARELDETGREREAARRVLTDLALRYVNEDWADLEPLPGVMAALLEQARPGLDRVARLTSPAEQRYLQAVSLLDGWLAERAAIHTEHLTLLGRPDRLGQLAEGAAAHLAQAAESLQAGLKVVAQHGLRLQPQFGRMREEVEDEVRSARQLGEQRPMPANRWARVSAEVKDRAAAFNRAMEELARQAAEARRQLEHANHQAHQAFRYESYDRLAGSSMRSALSAAELAESDGRYEEAIAMAAQAIHFALAVEAAYRAYMEEQERQRREAEERRRREEEEERRRRDDSFTSQNSSSTSGGGGSWGSSSDNDNRTSGGGGSW